MVTILFVGLLIAVAVIDQKTMKIPNKLVLAILLVSIVETILNPSISLIDRALGSCSVSLLLLLVNSIVPGGFGGGDVKLMGASGIFLGWKLCVLSFVFAVLGGGTYGAYLLLTKQKEKKDHFAFAPFLVGGMIVSLFWGVDVVMWYGKFLGIS